MRSRSERGLIHDLVLPTVLFAVVGGMTWAVRGSSGYGASAGCIFAGVMLGTAWWFIAREPGSERSRRYTSGWIILAMTVLFGIAGNRGWMQWSHFFEGRIQNLFHQIDELLFNLMPQVERFEGRVRFSRNVPQGETNPRESTLEPPVHPQTSTPS